MSSTLFYLAGERQSVTNCTLPDHTVAFVTSPNVRGSLELVWTCFATLLACVYTVLHFNVPSADDHTNREGATWVERLYNYIRRQRWLELACWIVVTVFIPEIVYTSALIEFIDARDQLESLHHFLKEKLGFDDEQCAKWKMVHMFYANMGGFVILHEKTNSQQKQESNVDRAVRRIGEFGEKATAHPLSRSGTRKSSRMPHLDLPSALRTPSDRGTRSASPDQQASGSTVGDSAAGPNTNDNHSTGPPVASSQWVNEVTARLDHTRPRFLEPTSRTEPNAPSIRSEHAVGGNHASSTHSDLVRNHDSHLYDQFHLNASTLRQAVESKLLLPEAIDTSSIDNLTSTDWFARTLIMFQLVQFFLSVLARVAENLPISELEVVVCAFALCSIIPYIVQWPKPQNVQTTIALAVYRKIPEEIIAAKNGSQAFGLRDFEIPSWVPGLKGSRPFGEYRNPGRAPPAIEPPVHHDGLDRIWILLLCCGGTVFGAIHLAAWNLGFPSFVDKWLWRGAALATTGLPFVWALFAAGRLYIEHRDKQKHEQNNDLSNAEKNVQSRRAGRDQEGQHMQERRKSQLEERHPIMHKCWQVIFFTGISIYILGRLILTVEMLRTLFYLPPRAYLMPDWPFSIPHIT